MEGGVEGGLANEDKVVVVGKIFEEETEFSQCFNRDEVGVVDDRNDVAGLRMEVSGFGDEAGFAAVVAAAAFEVEGLAEEAQDVVPGVQGAVDNGGDPVLGVVVEEVVFEDGFPGAGFAEDEAEATLVRVDFEDFKVALLVSQQRGVGIDGEGIAGEPEVLSDHGV